MNRFTIFTSALARAWMLSLLVGAYSVAAPLVAVSPLAAKTTLMQLPVGLEAALTLAVSMLLIFRTNRAYERWWEARTLWGALVNVSRNLAVKVKRFARPDAQERETTCTLIAAHAKALRHHLRAERCYDDLGMELSPLPQHVPARLVDLLYQQLAGWNRQQRISDEIVRLLDRELRAFLDICGGCERIRNTPVAVSWRTLVRQMLTVYVITLPWGLVESFGYWTIPLSILISYAVIAVEAIAHYIEEPFGREEDHLNLEAICDAIESSVSEILAE